MMKKIGAWIKKHKKLVIFLAVVIVITAGVLFIRVKTKEAMELLSQAASETAVVAVRDITTSITATGEIQSDSTKTVTSTLTGVKVASVNVEVGDVVAAGDTLCTFDVSDYEEKLEDAQESLDATEGQNDITVDNARRNLNDAKTTMNYQVESASRNLVSAWDSYMTARSAAASAQNDLDDLSTAKTNTKTAMDSAEAAMQAAEAEKQAAEESQQLSATPSDWAATVTDLTAAYDDAQDAYSGATTTYNTAKSAYDAQAAAVDAKDTAERTALRAYEAALSTYNYTVSVQGSSVEGSENAVESSELSTGVNTQTQESAIETYNEQIEKGVLAAPLKGTVTAVNVEAGDQYAGGAAVTIQDTDALIVVAQIDEYDIADVQVGMQAIFKTDATRDEELQGEVIFVSPMPTATAGTGVTYEVKIAIHSDTERLRLGMTAKLNIIIKETKGVLTVPYDAVQTDENGNDVVYISEKDEQGIPTRRTVPVTVGAEGDYYVEIIGDVKEGEEVQMPSDNLTDIVSMMQEMRDEQQSEANN